MAASQGPGGLPSLALTSGLGLCREGKSKRTSDSPLESLSSADLPQPYPSDVFWSPLYREGEWVSREKIGADLSPRPLNPLPSPCRRKFCCNVETLGALHKGLESTLAAPPHSHCPPHYPLPRRPTGHRSLLSHQPILRHLEIGHRVRGCLSLHEPKEAESGLNPICAFMAGMPVAWQSSGSSWKFCSLTPSPLGWLQTHEGEGSYVPLRAASETRKGEGRVCSLACRSSKPIRRWLTATVLQLSPGRGPEGG